MTSRFTLNVDEMTCPLEETSNAPHLRQNQGVFSDIAKFRPDPRYRVARPTEGQPTSNAIVQGETARAPGQNREHAFRRSVRLAVSSGNITQWSTKECANSTLEVPSSHEAALLPQGVASYNQRPRSPSHIYHQQDIANGYDVRHIILHCVSSGSRSNL